MPGRHLSGGLYLVSWTLGDTSDRAFRASERDVQRPVMLLVLVQPASEPSDIGIAPRQLNMAECGVFHSRGSDFLGRPSISTITPRTLESQSDPGRRTETSVPPLEILQSVGDKEVAFLTEAARNEVGRAQWGRYLNFLSMCTKGCECEGGPQFCEKLADDCTCPACWWMTKPSLYDYLYIQMLVDEYFPAFDVGRSLFQYRETFAKATPEIALLSFLTDRLDRPRAEARVKEISERSPGLLKYVASRLHELKYQWEILGYRQRDREAVGRAVKEGRITIDDALPMLGTIVVLRVGYDEKAGDEALLKMIQEAANLHRP